MYIFVNSIKFLPISSNFFFSKYMGILEILIGFNGKL